MSGGGGYVSCAFTWLVLLRNGNFLSAGLVTGRKERKQKGYPACHQTREGVRKGTSREQLSVSCVPFFPNKVSGFVCFKVVSEYLRISPGKLDPSLPLEGRALMSSCLRPGQARSTSLFWVHSLRGYSLRKTQRRRWGWSELKRAQRGPMGRERQDPLGSSNVPSA